MTQTDADLVLTRHGRDPDDAPVLLFLHGLTDSGSGWPEAVSHWEDAFTIVALDQRGHGGSPRFTPQQLQASPGDVMVADALGVLQQLAQPHGPAVVHGHSLGGAVALTAAVRRPDLVRALVLEDPAPLGPHEPVADLRAGAAYLAGVRDSLDAPDDAALLAVRRAAHPDWPESELLVTGRAEQQTDLAYLAGGNFKPTTPWPELFAQVAVPTLLLSGDATSRMPELCIDDDVERGLEAAGNEHIRFVRVPGAGHCIRRDQPERFYAEVDRFLRDQGLDAPDRGSGAA